MRRALWTLARAHAAEALSRVQDAIGEWRVRHGLLTTYEREQWTRLTSRHLAGLLLAGVAFVAHVALSKGTE